MRKITPAEALTFLDPELALFPRSTDLVRVLLDDQYQTEPIEIGERDEESLCGRLAYHRVLPQLHGAISEGRITSSDRLNRSLTQMMTGIAITGLRLERMLTEVGQLFSAVDVDFLVLKGLATGHLDHGHPSLRQAADIDILVRLDEFDRAGSALATSGFVLRPATSVSLMDKGETWDGPLGDSVDVHARLHTAGRPITEEWWESSETFEVAGHTFRSLSRAGRMAHAASHYSVSYPNHRILSSLLDLLVISRTVSDEVVVDANRFLYQVGVSDLVLRITTRAAALLEEPGIVVGQVGHRPMDAALRRAYDRADLDKVALKLAKTMGMPRADRSRVLRNWIAPTDEFLVKGGYTSRRDRVTKIARRQLDRWK